ncbi:MAG: flagellar hook-basal body protein FliE [Marinicaulis sp.]|nr:flagellar hook-basal body complex protein FliE [Marinicaulis sp.]NNE41855.1 flagellar hook-basal body protein FliE [Marinicaulis sp.]NNL90291.1 flagellar hook-basal body protein FliE [Marinicaulis sp.]
MEVNAFNALNAYGSAKKSLGSKAAANASDAENSVKFSPTETAKEFVGAIINSEKAATAMMAGDADPHSVVEAMASAELAVETAVTLRNRVVEAYQELLRMPV